MQRHVSVLGLPPQQKRRMRVLLAILAVIFSIVQLGGAIYIMLKGAEGWGLLLFSFFLSLPGTYKAVGCAMKERPYL